MNLCRIFIVFDELLSIFIVLDELLFMFFDFFDEFQKTIVYFQCLQVFKLFNEPLKPLHTNGYRGRL